MTSWARREPEAAVAPELRMPQPEPTPRRTPSPKVAPYPLYDRWSMHPGRRLTPIKLLGAYDAADDGDPIDQCDIFDDRIEADAHLRSVKEQRINAVARKRWVLLPGGDSDADVLAAELLEERLRLVPNFRATLAHQLSCNFYGYAASEIDWRREDGVIAPVWFENVPARRFRFDENDRPLLVTAAETRGAPLDAGCWWFSAGDGRVIAASGLMRTATWWSMFKSYSVRDWLVWANRFGLPTVHGKYSKEEGSAPEDIAALKKAVQALGRDGWSVFDDTCEIVITQAQSGGKAEDVHGALTALCDQQISKLISGATLLSETTGQASYAIGRVHEGRGFALIEGDAEFLADGFESSIGRPFVLYNGMKARPPRLKIYVVQDTSPDARAKVFAIARNEIGLALDADQVRQELQLRKPTGEALEPPAAPAKENGNGPQADPE